MSNPGAGLSPELKVEVEKTPTQTIVRCTGRITSSTAELLKSTVRPLIPDTQRILIDLTSVSFLDSSGLGAIVGFWVSAKKAKHELRLANANERIVDLFLMSNLAPIFEGHDEYLGVTPD
jgi:anti-sigma B factor antagonist